MSFSKKFTNKSPIKREGEPTVLPTYEVKARTFRNKKTEKNFNDITSKYNEAQKNYLYDKVKDYKIKRRNPNLIDRWIYDNKPHVDPLTKSIVLPQEENFFEHWDKEKKDEWIKSLASSSGKSPDEIEKEMRLNQDRRRFLSEITHSDQINKMGRVSFIGKYLKKDLPMQMGVIEGNPYTTPGTLEYGHIKSNENIRQGLDERSNNPEREFIKNLKIVKAKTWQEKMEEKNKS